MLNKRVLYLPVHLASYENRFYDYTYLFIRYQIYVLLKIYVSHIQKSLPPVKMNQEKWSGSGVGKKEQEEKRLQAEKKKQYRLTFLEYFMCVHSTVL